MDGNRPLPLGNDIGCKSGPIHWFIFRRNHSKGKLTLCFIRKIIILCFNNKHSFSTERNDFKREPCKVFSLDGWSAQLIDQTGQQMNTFQLINTQLGTVYKFRTNSPNMTVQWLDSLRRRSGTDTSTMDTHLPAVNLMTFE